MGRGSDWVRIAFDCTDEGDLAVVDMIVVG